MLVDALAAAPRWRWRDVLALGKPRLSLLVLCTTGVGLHLAPGQLPWPRALLIVAATALVVGAANALNCYLERDVDSLMRRTRQRPLPAQRLDPRVALAVSLGVGAAAIMALYKAANPLTALLSFAAFALYGWVYTPMKRYSGWAVVVGAIPGAIPPLMGWTAMTAHIQRPGLALFALLFFWQLPHFLAISIYLKDDYARGGLRVWPLQMGHRRAVGLTVASAFLLLPASLWPAYEGLGGPVYVAVALSGGVAFMTTAVLGLWQKHPGRWARCLFLGSIGYLTVMLGALMLGAR